MNTTFWVWTHLSFILLAGRGLLYLTRKFDIPEKGIAAALLLIAVLGITPYQGVDLSGWVLALTGMLSTGSLMMLVLGILPKIGIDTGLEHERHSGSWPLWLMLGLGLYPASLGWGNYDPYVWGYDPLMSWVCLGLSPIFWLLRQRLIGLWLSLSVLAWTLELAESPNLWDYLIDPWLVIASAVWLVSRLFAKRPQVVGEEGP
jgi:hypothetical protein